MSCGVFGGIWRFGRELEVFPPESSSGRRFLGFLEPLSLTDGESFDRGKPYLVPRERFRLIAPPEEDFFGGKARRVDCGGECFELVSIKEIYLGEAITHREALLLRTGEVSDGI